jgi:hypothetical protein
MLTAATLDEVIYATHECRIGPNNGRSRQLLY